PRQDGHARLGHRRAVVCRHARPRGEPARPRGRWLLRGHARLPARAAGGRPACRRHGRPGPRGHDRLRARAPGVRRAPVRQAGRTSPAGGDGHRHRGRPLADVCGLAEIRDGRGCRARRLDGQAVHGGNGQPRRVRLRAAARRVRLHARIPGGAFRARRAPDDDRRGHERDHEGHHRQGDRSMKLKDRAAVVTGGASGIGRAIVHALAREGARVAVFDLDEAGARETVTAIERAGSTGGAYRVDITDVAAVDHASDAVAARGGGLHVLVNCAGWDKPMPFVETTPEFWDKILAVNLRGPLACTRAALRHMIKAEYGKIITIASDAGRVGSTGEAVYSAAKGGLIAFTKTVAREVERHRINVNCVCPGPSDTPLFQKEFAEKSPKLAESLKRVIPWGRLGVPDDVAPAVVFLASDDASFITGQTLSVSGGLTMV